MGAIKISKWVLKLRETNIHSVPLALCEKRTKCILFGNSVIYLMVKEFFYIGSVVSKIAFCEQTNIYFIVLINFHSPHKLKYR